MVTTKDIAEKLRLSQATVSRALNNKGRVNKETKQRILNAAKEMGYIPSLAARTLVTQQKIKMAVILFSHPEYFWQKVRKGVEEAGLEVSLLGIEVDVFVTPIDQPQKQIELMEQLAQQQYRAICIAPSDPSVMIDVIDSLVDQGIYVVVLDADVSMSRRLCYMGCNYIQAGRLAGELMAKMLHYSGTVAMLAFDDGIQPIQQRITGFRSVIDDYPDVHLYGPFKFKRNGQDAYQKTCDLISEMKLDGLYVSYGILEEVAEALIQTGKAGEICVIGYDLSEKIADFIQRDVITATITHEPILQGYHAVKTMYHYILDSAGVYSKSSIMYTKLEAVFKENLQYYLD